MQREHLIPRPDWPKKMEDLGFSYHSIDGIYWDERVCYRFSAEQIDLLERATAELHQLCIEAAGHVIEHKLYDRFAIPEKFVPLIEESWNDDAGTLFGRFDLSWNGSMEKNGAPRLLEYNADTPTSLLEASVAQWYWLQEVKPQADQFNSLHEKLIERWKLLKKDFEGKIVHFTCVGDSEEDVGNLDYMRDVATQAGIDARFIDITHIGWAAVEKCFVDERNEPIHTLFKLYPWEWMIHEAFGMNLLTAEMITIEPAWKMLLSNKAILPVLWEMFPDHPNLLPAYFERQRFATDYVKKPILSREGANVTIRTAVGELSVPGEYGQEGFIYQAYHPLPQYEDGSHTVIGSWIVGDEPAGMGIREDESPVTKNTSRFVPHYFV